MNATVICPSDRAPAAFFARQRPLALTPLLGRTLLDRAISTLAQQGVKHVRVLAADRPEQIRAALRNGKPWGIAADVVPVTTEPAVQTGDSITLDHWPGEPHMSLWDRPAQWFDLMLAAMPEAGRDTIGMHEMEPGIWIGTRARVSPKARLITPCWIGQNATVEAEAVIGPRSIVEEGAYVDGGAEVIESFVGPATYVGGLTELRSSLAWGSTLLNWRTSSCTGIHDAFLLADLSRRFRSRRAGSVAGRVAAGLGLMMAAPVFALASIQGIISRQPVCTIHRGVHAPLTGDTSLADTLTWRSLNGVPRMFRRLPELWNILRGEFAWIGNRPLTREQAEELTSDFDRLWLAVAPGILSLADAHGCRGGVSSDAARAHSAFYAVRAGWCQDVSVFTAWLLNKLRHFTLPPHAQTSPLIQP